MDYFRSVGPVVHAKPARCAHSRSASVVARDVGLVEARQPLSKPNFVTWPAGSRILWISNASSSSACATTYSQ